MLRRRHLGALALGLSAAASAPACYDFGLDAVALDGGALDDATGRPDGTGTSTPDGGPPRLDATSEAGCPPGRATCGGHLVSGAADLVFRCEADGGATRLAKCANGCVVGAAGSDDACRPPTACQLNGRYCGGDKINGDPDTLYRCGSNGSVAVIARCGERCVVADAGSDDYCEP